MNGYRFVDGEYERSTEIKRSKFIATTLGEIDGKSAEEFVRTVKKKYPDATHHCYAYIADALGNSTRFSDDGEPCGTAGQPILEVLRKQNLVKTVVIVTRYFGGIKLGTGGLHAAYSDAAADVLKAAKIAEKQLCRRVNICADYSDYALLETRLRRDYIKTDEVEYGNKVSIKAYVVERDIKPFLIEIRELTADRANITVFDGDEYIKMK